MKINSFKDVVSKLPKGVRTTLPPIRGQHREWLSGPDIETSGGCRTIHAQSQIKIWLDDEREMPGDFTHWAKTAAEAIDLLKQGNVVAISLDHDLGVPDAGTGYDVVKFIEESAYFNRIPRLQWRVHSANGVGRVNMAKGMESADRFWDKHENTNL